MQNSQRRAIQNYRARLTEKGLARFEILGRASDRDLIRTLVRRLLEDTLEASQLRATICKSLAGEGRRPGCVASVCWSAPISISHTPARKGARSASDAIPARHQQQQRHQSIAAATCAISTEK